MSSSGSDLVADDLIVDPEYQRSLSTSSDFSRKSSSISDLTDRLSQKLSETSSEKSRKLSGSERVSSSSESSIDYSKPAKKSGLKEFEQNIYRVDKVLNNFEPDSQLGKSTKLNLLNLLKAIPMLYTVEKNSKGNITKVIESPGEGFISGYVSSIHKDTQFTFHRPPKGPIQSVRDDVYKCIYCGNESGEYHDEMCLRPEESSLVLKDDMSKSYSESIKKRGTKKLVSARETGGVLPNSLSLSYRSDTIATIKISKTGKIIITGIPLRLAKSIDGYLENVINDADSSAKPGQKVITEQFKVLMKVMPIFKNKFKILPDISYINTLKSQSYMTDEIIKKGGDYNVLIDFDKVNKVLNMFRKKFGTGDNNRYTFPLGINYIKYQKSKKGQESRAMIRFYVNVKNFKIHVQIESHGSIQMIFSLCSEKNVKERVCKELSDSDLSSKVFKKFHKDLTGFLQKYKHDYLQIHEILKKLTVSKKNKKVYTHPSLESIKTITTKCVDPKRRANPNVFKHMDRNHCVTNGYLMLPYGVYNDKYKLWEPCCYKSTGPKLRDYRNAILYGLPSKSKPALTESIMTIGKISTGDDRQNTTTYEDRKFKGIVDYNKDDIYKCLMNVITKVESSGSDSSGGSLRSMISQQTRRSMATIDTEISSRISKKLKKYKEVDYEIKVMVKIYRDSEVPRINRYVIDYPVFIPNIIISDHIDLTDSFIRSAQIDDHDKLIVRISSLNKRITAELSENIDPKKRSEAKLVTESELFEGLQKIFMLKYYKKKEALRNFGITLNKPKRKFGKNKFKNVKKFGKDLKSKNFKKYNKFNFMNKIIIRNPRKPL